MDTQSNAENKFGRTSQVKLETQLKDGKVILSDVFFTAPFKVMLPFYVSPDYMQVMILSASAGIMEGDVQDFFIHVNENTNMEYLSQSYEKIHKMVNGMAKRNTKIVVEPNAFLKYAPLPTIPFKASAFDNNIEVILKDTSSKLLFQEILSCGRVARNELFQYRFYHNHVTVYQGEDLIYFDNTKYEPSKFDMSGIGMYEGYTHMLNLVFFNIQKTDEWIIDVRQRIDNTEDMQGGVTRICNGNVFVRILGKGAEPLLKLSDKIQAISCELE